MFFASLRRAYNTLKPKLRPQLQEPNTITGFVATQIVSAIIPSKD
jgi:hypothetical protein